MSERLQVMGIGGNENGCAVIAGPCAIESKMITDRIADSLKRCGVRYLRGGAFKPRTNPKEFQGMRKAGIEILREIGDKYQMVVVTEIVDTEHIPMFEELVDIIQVGAKNCFNYELLKKLGKCKKPVMLKRGASAKVSEWLMAADYIRHGGNENVILCERGIRSFEDSTRFTLDISSVQVVKELSKLPVVVDPSHAAGRRSLVRSMTLAAVAAGADGVMVEVHEVPSESMVDAEQALDMLEFSKLVEDVELIREVRNVRGT